ncbi:MAG: hypothetical protein HC800_25045 [Phormidesmis sp. RL_2_1]|nr:hypothetical protein [Phormidesmis sp. RL_2_1]
MVVERWVRGRTADEDEIESSFDELLAERLTAVEVITENRHPRLAQALVIRIEPALRRRNLAVLFVVTVLGRDEFGHQRQSMGLIRADHHWL